MKKIIMAMAVAVAATLFAAQNDPLISVEVEKGASYDVVCKGESLFTFTPSKTGKVNVQGVGAKSMNVADYQINLLAAAPAESDAVVLEDFETPGPDSYGDSIRVLEGEVYALVWMKKDADFKGFAIEKDKGVVCVDEANNWFTRVYGLADSSGKCVRGGDVTLDPPTGWEDGHFAVYLLDTRKPGMNDLAEKSNGLPTFVKGYKEVTSGEAVTPSGWTMLKFGKTGQQFAFDPTSLLEKGYAAIQSADGKWTVYEMPKAYHQKVENQTIAKEGLTILCHPTNVNSGVTLDLPFTLETTHRFLAFTGVVAKAVNEILPYMPKDNFGCADFKSIDAVNAAATQAVIDGKLTTDEVAEAGAFLNAVSPFWSWNCDFEVSFDRPIKAGSYVLAGYYKQASNFNFDGWVASAFEEDLPAGKSLRLLKDNNYSGVYVSYYEICSRVQEFLCGAKNLSPDNYGTTISVKLNIYDNEHDVKATVDTYKYTFGGPLYVNCYTNGSDVAVTNICEVDHKGTDECALPVVKSVDDSKVFVGWSLNRDGTGAIVTTIPRMVHEVTTDNPVKTWYTQEEPLELYAVYKSAQKVTVTAKTEDGDTQTTLKVTDEWLEAQNIRKDDVEAIAKEMNDDDPNGLKKWQNYVIGNTNNTAHLEVVRTEGETEEKAVVISNMTVPPPDSGFKVTYSLDKIDATETKTEKPGAEQDTSDVKIELQREDGDTPTGYYKMNIFIRPDDQPDAKVEPIKAVETVGVLKLESTEPVIPVAVPWNSLEDGKEIKVDQIVKTSTLSDGDLIHIYDKEKKAYINLEVQNGEWKQTGAVKIDDLGNVTDETLSQEELDLTTATRGSSIFLERKTDTSKPVYLLGQYKKDEEATTAITAPDSDKGEVQAANLIAPTSIEPTDLNEVIVPSKVQGEIGENDQLMLVRDGLPSYYKFKNGKWGYNKPVYEFVNGKPRMRQQWVTDDAVVPAGVGLWYLSKGGAPTIKWPKDAE